MIDGGCVVARPGPRRRTQLPEAEAARQREIDYLKMKQAQLRDIRAMLNRTPNTADGGGSCGSETVRVVAAGMAGAAHVERACRFVPGAMTRWTSELE